MSPTYLTVFTSSSRFAFVCSKMLKQKKKKDFLAMRRNTISGCLLESVSLGKIPLRESQSNLRKDTLNYDLNYIDYPNINHKMLTYF